MPHEETNDTAKVEEPIDALADLIAENRVEGKDGRDVD
jgi:hypothetical protein